MNRSILRLAVPSVVSNIVVPLLGLMDLAIAGHLGATAFIGAVAVGAMMFNLTYWNFGFLRMGTSGLTAQAFGRADWEAARRILCRAFLLGFLLGLLIILLQYPLQWLLLRVIGPGGEVLGYARGYFFICVWGAPAMLATMSLSGWFLGMQNSYCPMLVSIAVNVLNIAVSLLCVFPLGMGFYGIAIGTLVSQWGGLALAVALLFRFRNRADGFRMAEIRKAAAEAFRLSGLREMRQFFRVNADIFLRSVCLMLVTLFFTSAGARSGDVVLAVNALIMQLFVFYSYFMDGFAFAGEALAGRYAGAGNFTELRRCIRRLFAWAAAVMLLFVAAYSLSGEGIIALLTDDPAVVERAAVYRWWAVAVPVAGMAAFIWDGVYIGLTATRQMLLSLLAATLVFFCISCGFVAENALFPPLFPDSNDTLWFAFIAYLAVRSLVQTLLYPCCLKKQA